MIIDTGRDNVSKLNLTILNVSMCVSHSPSTIHGPHSHCVILPAILCPDKECIS